MLPCILFEDEHLLVVNKPAGLNTHAPSPYAGEGLYDWLRHREPRWANLAIIHRLDKETSGVLVFSKTSQANRALTEQFTRRTVRKKYLLLTDRPVPRVRDLIARTCLARAGERYVSRPVHPGGEIAETHFRLPASTEDPSLSTHRKTLTGAVAASPPQEERAGERRPPTLLEAAPFTGRTHQIRVHAAEKGFPILGDTLYGGTPARRVCLHAAELAFRHPASGEKVTFRAPVDFRADPRQVLRTSLIDPELTTAFRIVHGASDGWPGWYVERLGEYLLSQAEQAISPAEEEELGCLVKTWSCRGAYHKLLTRQVRRATSATAGPQPVRGEAAPERFTVRENGLAFELSFAEGYSFGLFLDQRDNRRRLLTRHIGSGFPLFPAQSGTAPAEASVLNTFAYTCGFSVCAAKAGARTTSLDLSKKYLEWGRRNFTLNRLDPAEHEFIYGDTFDWLRRLAKRQRRFDLILLDPPTFSQSRESGVFRVEKDYGKLIRAALPLLSPGGVLFASSNAASWPPEEFVSSVEAALRSAGRHILQQHYVPQPPDFPVSRAERAYLKTIWLRVG